MCSCPCHEELNPNYAARNPNPLKKPPNPTAETLTLEKSPNPAQTLTLRSKVEARGLPERRGGRCRRHGNPDGERTLGTWSRAASRAPGRPGPPLTPATAGSEACSRHRCGSTRGRRGALRAPSSSTRRSCAPAFAARSSGERSSVVSPPSSAPARRSAPLAAVARSTLSSLGSPGGEKREGEGENEVRVWGGG